MKFFRQTIFTVALASALSNLHAQFEAAVFDYQNAYFNNGQPLKPEADLLISGAIPKEIQRVEVLIYNNQQKDKKPLYKNVWKRSFGNVQESFQVPLTYPLRGNSEYDIVIDYYREVSAAEKDELRKTLYQLIDKYVEESFVVNKWKLKALRSQQEMLHEMNHLVSDILFYYRNDTEMKFSGFSDMVAEGFRPLKEPHLRNQEVAEFASFDNELYKKSTILAAVYKKRIAELKDVLHLELSTLLNAHLLIRSDSRHVLEYPTEKEKGEIAVNVGYGGLYLGDYKNDLTLGGAPFVGLSIPFGKSTFSSAFLSNSSLSIGAMVMQPKGKDNSKVSGPLFGLPIYAGLGYKMFNFARLTAGVAATNNANGSTNINNRFQIRPFVGISAELNLSMRMGNKKK